VQFTNRLVGLSFVLCSAAGLCHAGSPSVAPKNAAARPSVAASSTSAAGSVVLSLASGSGSAGGSVVLNLNQTSSGGALPAALQWSFSYSSDITGVTVTAGSSASNAQKTVTCVANTCLIEAVNANIIADGTVAVATFQLAAKPSSSTIPILVSGVAVSSAAGVLIPSSGTGGAITVTASAPPSVPANLKATAVSSSQINLSWSASTDSAGSVAGYVVYRNSSQVATVTAGTTYSDTGLSASTSYSYTVAAYDGAGNHSATSSAASATTLPSTVSVATTVTTNPGGLSLTVDGQSYTAPQSFSWTSGSSHTLAVSSPQNSTTGTLYAWANWSDGGAISHTITAMTATTYTANFNPTSTTTTPPPASSTPTGGTLAAYWKLDEPRGVAAFADASGNGNTGTCGATCPTMGVAGAVRTAASFNGINSQITVPDSPSLRLNQFTIVLWAYPTQMKSDFQPLVVKEDSTGNNRNYGLFILPNSMQVRYTLWGSNCATPFPGNSVGRLPLNTWTQIAFSFDGAVEKFYMNGVLDSSNAASPSSLCQAAFPVKIGMETSAFQPFKGTLDDIQIYNQALTAPEVSNLYSPLVAHWKLDEPSGATSFADSSGNGNTGTCSVGACPAMGFLGKVGTGASFNGTTSQVTIPDSPSLHLSQFTIALWVNPRQIKSSDYQPLIVKEDSAGNNRTYWLSISPGSTHVHFAVWASDCATKYTGDSIASLALNAWTHVALTYDGSIERLYINGALDHAIAFATASLCQAAVPVKLGKETSAFQPFNGVLDDIQIYSQALSAPNVMNLYLNGLSGQ